ncbi:MAG: Signal transduction histidine kinase [Ferruginibacter sp.]|uniref:sensor histidine kinase n=1 Tax=Ferruginibacter sp. TaxID=1940288 RepID=UPI002659A67C|nr:histidine kinase [Ferruginibacter sp.]MDB5280866.1 Signal transduction histidine kinase [Ferruginibacter sp.]
MTPPRSPLRNFAEPLFGAAFTVLWLFGESGRVHPPGYSSSLLEQWLPFILVGVVIGTSRVLPWISLAAGGILLIGQLAFESLRFSDVTWPAYLGLLLAAVVIGANPVREARLVALPVSVAYGLCVGLLLRLPNMSAADRYGVLNDWGSVHGRAWSQLLVSAVLVAIIAAASWSVGYGFWALLDRTQSDLTQKAMASDLANAELELRLVDERDRIARDVHDIMAHSLAVIVAQADGARFLSEKRPASTGESLQAIAQSARESLVEVRMLIDSLGPEPEDAVAPTLDELPALIQRMRAAGLSITQVTDGAAVRLTAGQQLAVYRIVQESLTNALKHGGDAARAEVAYRWSEDGLTLTVTSHGAGRTASGGTAKRGLRGMRERARLAGGWLTAGPSDQVEDNSFVVEAFLPPAEALFAAPAPSPESVAL